jgi:hypothetical protein
MQSTYKLELLAIMLLVLYLTFLLFNRQSYPEQVTGDKSLAQGRCFGLAQCFLWLWGKTAENRSIVP